MATLSILGIVVSFLVQALGAFFISKLLITIGEKDDGIQDSE